MANIIIMSVLHIYSNDMHCVYIKWSTRLQIKKTIYIEDNEYINIMQIQFRWYCYVKNNKNLMCNARIWNIVVLIIYKSKIHEIRHVEFVISN